MADLTIYRGDTVRLNIAVTSAGAAYDLTGVEIWMTAKLEVDDSDAGAVFQKTTFGGGITVTAALSGLAQIQIDPADTEGLDNRKTSLVYDIQIMDASDAIFTVAYGNLIVLPDITRSVTVT